MAQIKKAHHDLSTARELLAKSGIRPRKRLGQHFLQDPSVIDQIIARARFSETDVAVEVGAGLGALTIPILAHVSHVVAVEKDPLLIAILEERLPKKQNSTFHFNIPQNLLEERNLATANGGRMEERQ